MSRVNVSSLVTSMRNNPRAILPKIPSYPKTDDAYDFGCEVQRMLGHIKAIVDVLAFGDHKEV